MADLLAGACKGTSGLGASGLYQNVVKSVHAVAHCDANITVGNDANDPVETTTLTVGVTRRCGSHH